MTLTLALLGLLALVGCGGGSDSSTAEGDDQAEFLYFQRADVAGYGCALNGNYRDCDAYNTGVNYFNTQCSKGSEMGCYYSRTLTSNYFTYRLSMAPRG